MVAGLTQPIFEGGTLLLRQREARARFDMAAAQLALVLAQMGRLNDTAALFEALGGGWWNRSDMPPNAALTMEE